MLVDYGGEGQDNDDGSKIAAALLGGSVGSGTNGSGANGSGANGSGANGTKRDLESHEADNATWGNLPGTGVEMARCGTQGHRARVAKGLMTLMTRIWKSGSGAGSAAVLKEGKDNYTCYENNSQSSRLQQGKYSSGGSGNGGGGVRSQQLGRVWSLNPLDATVRLVQRYSGRYVKSLGSSYARGQGQGLQRQQAAEECVEALRPCLHMLKHLLMHLEAENRGGSEEQEEAHQQWQRQKQHLLVVLRGLPPVLLTEEKGLCNSLEQQLTGGTAEAWDDEGNTGSSNSEETRSTDETSDDFDAKDADGSELSTRNSGESESEEDYSEDDSDGYEMDFDGSNGGSSDMSI